MEKYSYEIEKARYSEYGVTTDKVFNLEPLVNTIDNIDEFYPIEK